MNPIDKVGVLCHASMTTTDVYPYVLDAIKKRRGIIKCIVDGVMRKRHISFIEQKRIYDKSLWFNKILLGKPGMQFSIYAHKIETLPDDAYHKYHQEFIKDGHMQLTDINGYIKIKMLNEEINRLSVIEEMCDCDRVVDMIISDELFEILIRY